MSIQQAQISIKRLTEIMDYESEQDLEKEYTEMEAMDGDIEFKDVTFRYGNRSPALSHVSFTIPNGEEGGTGGPVRFRQVHHHQTAAQVL